MRVLVHRNDRSYKQRPLLPYADALLNRGHEVLVAAQEEAGAIIRDAGLDHAVFGHPGYRRFAEIYRASAGKQAQAV